MGSKGPVVKCEVRSEYEEMSQSQLGGNSMGIWLLIITMLLKACISVLAASAE